MRAYPFLLFLLLATSPLRAGEASGCADLEGFQEVPRVDFHSQVQPILDACSGCHGDGGAAGLDLRPGQAYPNLVGMDSTTNPGRLRVEPFRPDRSVLLAAINCQNPGGPSFQMPGTVPAERALIRDWIAQGAFEQPPAAAVPTVTPLGAALMVLLLLLAGLTRVYDSRRRTAARSLRAPYSTRGDFTNPRSE